MKVSSTFCRLSTAVILKIEKQALRQSVCKQTEAIELIVMINAYIVENSENNNDNSENEPVRNLSVHRRLLRNASDPLDLPDPA